MKKVLFVCVHNSGRSQMAEAFAHRIGKRKITAESAGTQPAEVANPLVVEAMREIGYDIGNRCPKAMTSEMVSWADKIVTMGCAVAACPAAFAPSEDWGLEDPEGQPIEKVRQIRDRIEQKVRCLVKEVIRER